MNWMWIGPAAVVLVLAELALLWSTLELLFFAPMRAMGVL